MCVDGNGKDTSEPIVFSEWTFPFNDGRIQRKDYSFAELLNNADRNETIRTTGQQTLFSDENGEEEPLFLAQYITNYRRLADHE